MWVSAKYLSLIQLQPHHSGNCPNPSSTQEPKQQEEPIAWDGKAASELS